MFDQTRWSPYAALPIAGGLAWFWFAADFGLPGFLASMAPGCLLLASGISILLWPGDPRIVSFTALGGVLGVPLALPAFVVAGPATALLLIGVSVASFLAAGAVAVRWEPHTPHVPVPEPSLRLSARVAADETLLAVMQMALPMVSGDEWRRIRGELFEARDLFEARGWLGKSEAYHRDVPDLEAPSLEPRHARSRRFEHLRFESGYEPDADEPGRARWLSYAPNRTAHAWVIRHPGLPRPWLVLIHGLLMGVPSRDFAIFDPQLLADRLGLNLVYPVLPFHGPRKVGRLGGDGFFTGDILDAVHGVAQAMWDIRRILRWVRAQDAPAIGVHGVSLGGYQTALLAGLEGDLACAIAGVPLTDMVRTLWRHGPTLLVRQGEHLGVQRDVVGEVMSVVSPLALPPRVPLDRRYIFGAIADRLVLPDQVRDLWDHWERPRIVWYPGSHISFRNDPSVAQLVREALEESGLAPRA